MEKRLQLENVTYTILTEKDVAMNEKGKYFLAMIKTTENYDNLKESLADLDNRNCVFFRRRLEVSGPHL